MVLVTSPSGEYTVRLKMKRNVVKDGETGVLKCAVYQSPGLDMTVYFTHGDITLGTLDQPSVSGAVEREYHFPLTFNLTNSGDYTCSAVVNEISKNDSITVIVVQSKLFLLIFFVYKMM